MKTLQKVILVLIASLPLLVSAQHIKVLTFNIKAGAETSLDSLATYINDVNPDFVALQEVDVNTNRANIPQHNGKNILSELAARTGMFGLFGRTIDFAGGYYGIGLLSRYPIIKSEKVELPNPAENEPRVLLWALCELPNDKKIKMACTHLDYQNDTNRLLQAQALIDNLASDSVPTILAGDFNADPADGAAKAIEDVADLFTNYQYTFPAVNPTIKIDYIFGLPRGTFRLIDTQNPDIILSDHLPVISIIELLQ